MSNLTQLQQVLEVGYSLKLITQSYSEIAAGRLKKIRLDVERNRQFFLEISSIYHIIKRIAAERYNIKLQKNGKTICILLTSNYRFYGGLNYELVRYFTEKTLKIPTDRVVIGKTGLEIFNINNKINNTAENFVPLTFKKDLPSDEELKKLAELIQPYKRVFVFYSKFETVLNQIPVFKDITESQNQEPKKEEKHNIFDLLKGDLENPGQPDFIFEPEVPKILQFFDSQAITLILEQTFLESELARTAARLIAMDEAETRADKFIVDQNAAVTRTKHSIQNAKLLETFVALARGENTLLSKGAVYDRKDNIYAY